MGVLPAEVIRERLQGLGGWSLAPEGLTKTFTFADFRQAVRFVDAVADIAEARQHHPEITIRYKQVTLTTISHDSGGVTERDLGLAAQVEQIRIGKEAS